MNTHSSSSSGHPEGDSKVTPSISASSVPPSVSSRSGPTSEAAVSGVGDRRGNGVKEQPLSAGKSAGDSGGGSETGEPHSSHHLQQLLEKQLNQQKQAAMTGLGIA